jgi:hypothetical protein
MRDISCLVVPTPGQAFFWQTQFERLLGVNHFQLQGRAFEIFDFAGGGGSRRVASKSFPAKTKIGIVRTQGKLKRRRRAANRRGITGALNHWDERL